MSEQEKQVLQRYAVWRKYTDIELSTDQNVQTCLTCSGCSAPGCGGCGSCAGCSGAPS